MKCSLRQIFLTLIIPFLFLILCIYLKLATGPFYLGNNNDPSYLYLINSLYILDGRAPGFIQHPGTTLQLFGAAIIFCMTGGASMGVLVESVYRNPEQFLHGIYYALAALNAATFFLLGWGVLKRTGRILPVFLVQSSAVLVANWYSAAVAEGSIPVVANVNAENFLIAVTNVYGFLLIKLYFDCRDGLAVRRRWVIAFGIVCAAGTVTKTLFIAWALAPLFLIPGRNQKVIFFAAFLAGIAGWTIPIWSTLDHFFSWYAAAMTHTGSSGFGQKGLVDFGMLAANFVSLLKANIFYSLLWGAICVLAVTSVLFIRRKPEIAKDVLALRYVIVLGAAAFLTMMFISRQMASHYIVPTLNLLGVLCFFAYQTWPLTKDFFLRLGLIGMVLFNTGTVFAAGSKLAGINSENLAFSKKAYGDYKDCLVCGYYRSSSPAFALNFGDENQGYLAYIDVLKKVYPGTVFYHGWNRYFYDGRDIINYDDLKRQHSCIMLYGSHLPEDFNKKFVKVSQVASSRSEGLYKIERVTILESLVAFSRAQDLERAQRYAEAYSYAVQAKEMGLTEIGPYIESLLRKIVEQP